MTEVDSGRAARWVERGPLCCSEQENDRGEQSAAAHGVLPTCNHPTKHEDWKDEDAMPRFGNGKRRTDWLGTVSVLTIAAGFLFAAYLLVGLAGFLN